MMMDESERTPWDYSRWGEVIDHADVAAFESCADLQDGVHRIGLPDGSVLELLLAGEPLRPGRVDAVPLFFSGAIGDRRGTRGPYFSGRQLASRLGRGFVAISDPLFRDHSELGLAWYTGRPRSDAQAVMARAVQHLASISGRPILAIGGSGGGFAALELALRVDSVIAFVWNPQTRILDYDPTAVRKYLTALFGAHFDEPDWRSRAERLLDDAGFVHDLTRDADTPRGLYVQNATDWHVQRHLAPYLDAKCLPHRGRGYHGDTRSHGVLIGDFGDGHSVPAIELLDCAIRSLSATHGDAWAAFSTLSGEGFLSAHSFARLPVDLRPERAAVLDTLRLDAESTEHSVHAHVTRAQVGPPLTFQFYGYGISGRVANTPPGPSQKWRAETGEQVLRVVSTVRDGLGHELGQLEKAVRTSRNTPLTFVYGSCVSRDAFELAGAPPLAGYVARSGLASAMHLVPTGLEDADLSANPSAFQRRMVALDLQKEFPALLDRTAFERVLVDLIDERLSMARGPAGGLFTLSPELERTGISAVGLERIDAGSPAHLDGFRDGWLRFCALVGDERIVVNRVYWAANDETGAPVADSALVSSANNTLDALYQIIEALTPGVRWLNYDRALFVGDSNHRWGPSPFHFSQPLYREMLRQLAVV